MKRLPSASNAALRARCAGAWQLIQTLAAEGRSTDKANQAAVNGQLIHKARQTGSVADLPPELIKTKNLLDEMEQKLVAAWDLDPVLIGREDRLWYWHKKQLFPIHTGRFDYAYRNRDFSRVLIADDKTGRLEVPEAHLNDQMRELAALYYCVCPDSVQEITVAICQPWVTRKPSVATFDLDQLNFALVLLDKNLADIADPDAVRTPGVHCVHCPAAEVCEEKRAMIKATWKLADRIKAGEFALPLGKYGERFLDDAITAHKILAAIIEKYKKVLTADPKAVPGYYMKEGATRREITDPIGLMEALGLPSQEMIRIGRFSISSVVEAYAKFGGYPLDEAEEIFTHHAKDFTNTSQNEPSLAKVSPRKGKSKQLVQAEMLP